MCIFLYSSPFLSLSLSLSVSHSFPIYIHLYGTGGTDEVVLFELTSDVSKRQQSIQPDLIGDKTANLNDKRHKVVYHIVFILFHSLTHT